VIAAARSVDVVLMVLDATRPDEHRAALEDELVGWEGLGFTVLGLGLELVCGGCPVT
jgi:hypothetical protein